MQNEAHKSECAYMEISIDKLIQKENSRGDFKDSDIDELMTSMRQVGMLQPIGVRTTKHKGEYEVVFGNRRLAAAKKLGWTKVDAQVVGESGSKEDDIKFLIKNAIENLQRLDPNFIEQGRLFHSLIMKGLTKTEIAARIGIPKFRVDSIISAWEHLPKHIRPSVVINERKKMAADDKSGKISLKTVGAILGVSRRHQLAIETRDQLFNLAQKNGLASRKVSAAGNLLSQGFGIREVTAQIGSAKVVQVGFLLNEEGVKKLEKQTGKKIQQLIRDFVIKSGRFPISGVSKDVYKPVMVKKAVRNGSSSVEAEAK